MTLHDMVVKLLTQPGLDAAERQQLNYVIEINGDAALEGRLHAEVEAHIVGRYEWFFTPSGQARSRVA
jgi:hypothetical protein